MHTDFRFTCDTTVFTLHHCRYCGLNEPIPLKPIRKGGGRCSTDSQCGHGTCSGFWRKTCHCEEGHVGPRCLVPHYHDDITFDHEVDLTPMPIAVPLLLKCLAVLVAGAALAATVVTGITKSNQRAAYSAELKRARMQPPRL
jgi:hypothetical protein